MARIIKTINSMWKFQYFPEGEEKNDLSDLTYNDSSWCVVGIPHTWNTYETTGEIHPFIMSPSERDDTYWWYGWGCYRKKFVIDSMYNDKKIFVEFDGVQKLSKVWLNGKFVGLHCGGYTSFYFDITDYVNFNQENVLAVHVSNRRDDEFGGIPPMVAGNFNVYGGIYRDVRIVVKDKLHIPFQGSSEHDGGTYITTPIVTKDKGSVKIKTFVKNDYNEDKKCTVKALIFDAKDNIINQMESTMLIKAGHPAEYEQQSEEIEKPDLWFPENPNLYRVKIYLNNEEQVCDEIESSFGFRWFEWNYQEKRLYLNGKLIHIHGTNRHQEYPWLGDAIPKWMHKMDLEDIRFKLGHNFIRTCHYTQDPLVYDLCDKYGIIACEEVPVIKHQRFSEEVQKQMVKEMIRRDKNHPSILMWSMGNETYDAADAEWAKKEDATRIIHVRKAVRRGSDEKHNHEQLEMENLLRCTVRGWYNKDVKNLEPLNGQHSGHEEWQHQNALIEGASQRGRIDMNGVMWLYADHGADREYIGTPLKHINPKGWVDSYRIPKYMYYLWQANWSSKPMIFIHPYEWTERYLGERRDIIINSNCDYVELAVNNKIIGQKYPCKQNDFTVVFENVPVVKGKLTAKGKKDEKEVISELKLPGKPHKIVLKKSHECIEADISNIILITVDIVDKNGVHVYGANNKIEFEVDGCASLVAPDVFVSDINKNNSYEGTMYIDVPFNIPLRSNGKCGKITVRALSEGLADGKIELEAVPVLNNVVEGIIEPQLKNINLNRRFKSTRIKDVADKDNASALNDIVQDIVLQKLPESDWEVNLDMQIRNAYRGKAIDESIFCVFKKVLMKYLNRNKGILVADDFNFVVNLYNDCVKFCSFLNEAKYSEAFKNEIRKYFAEIIIEKMHIPLSTVVYNYINLPENSISVVFSKSRDLSDVVYVNSDDLNEVLTRYIKGFESMDASKKIEIFRVLQEINPYIEKIDQGGKMKYRLSKNRVILLPPIDYWN